MPDRNLNLALRVRADLNQAVRQLDRLERELRGTGTAAGRAGRQAGQAARGIERIDREARKASRSLSRMDIFFGNFAAGLSAAALSRGIATLAELPEALIESGLAAERLDRRFRFAAGSIAAGARELQFVRREADRLGIDFLTTANAYSGLANASRGTALEGQATREIFLAVAEAGRVMGLSAEQQSGALLALEQIMSKGKVSAEDLRGQLGERLPDAFQVAARAIGVSTRELDRMLAAGELLSDEFLPRFARALREHVAEGVPYATQDAEASFARLGNAIERLRESFARSGLLENLAKATDLATRFIDALSGHTPVPDAVQHDLERYIELRDALDRPAQGPRGPRPTLTLARTAAVELEEVERRLMTSGDAGAAALEAIANRAAQEIDRLQERIDRLEAVADRPDPRGRRRGTIEPLRRQIEELRRLRDAALEPRFRVLSILPDDPDFTFPPAPLQQQRGGDDGDAARDAERAAAVLAIRRRAEDAVARLTLDRIHLVDRAERQQLEELAALRQAGKHDEAAIEVAVLAVRRKARLEREAVAEEDAARDRARYEEEAARLADLERGLADMALALATPFDRTLVETDRWRTGTLVALRELLPAHEDYAERAAEVHRIAAEHITAAARQVAEAQAGAAAGGSEAISGALSRYADDALDTFDEIERATADAARGMEDALVNFARTGEIEFRSLADSIIADLARIAVQRAITGPLSAALGGLLGLGGGSFRGVSEVGGHLFLHAGGVAGAPGGSVRHGVDPRAFAGAPRFPHGGLASDEVPAILRRGEGVFTPEQMRAMGGAPNLEVRLINEGGTPQEATDDGVRWDGEKFIVTVLLRDARGNGPVTQAFRHAVSRRP